MSVNLWLLQQIFLMYPYAVLTRFLIPANF